MTKVGSGILPIAVKSKRICLAWRSVEIRDGDCFGIIGGMVKKGLTPLQGALLEMKEEVGYTGPIQTHPAHVLRRPGFEYHNFVATVPYEFPFRPEPEFAYETDYILWMEYAKITMFVEKQSSDFHPGLVELLRESKTLIESFL